MLSERNIDKKNLFLPNGKRMRYFFSFSNFFYSFSCANSTAIVVCCTFVFGFWTDWRKLACVLFSSENVKWKTKSNVSLTWNIRILFVDDDLAAPVDLVRSYTHHQKQCVFCFIYLWFYVIFFLYFFFVLFSRLFFPVPNNIKVQH